MKDQDRHGLTPTQIRYVLKESEFQLRTETFTKAHVNKNEKYYWANPKESLLNYNWTLILDDDINKVLHVFEIDGGTFYPENFSHRHDRPDELDIEINYNDLSFEDRRSGMCFDQYKVFETDYESVIPCTEMPVPNELYETEERVSYRRSLSQIPDDIVCMDIKSFEFLDIKYFASAWKNILIVVLGYLYNKYPKQVEQLVDYPNDTFQSLEFSRNKLIYGKDDIPHEIKPFTGLFYKTNNSVKTIVRQIKDLLRYFDENLDQIVVDYEVGFSPNKKKNVSKGRTKNSSLDKVSDLVV